MTKTETKNAHVNLAAIVHESEEAAKAAAEAQARAQVAQAKAEAAKERAEAERQAANERYLHQLQAAYPQARDQATAAAGEARERLEAIVAGTTEGDLIRAYLSWADALTRAWEVESELVQQRHYLGMPTRPTDPPVFRFDIDIAAIIDRHSMELQDEALERIRERRVAFLSGQER